jgi:hypothetical protein
MQCSNLTCISLKFSDKKRQEEISIENSSKIRYKSRNMYSIMDDIY